MRRLLIALVLLAAVVGCTRPAAVPQAPAAPPETPPAPAAVTEPAPVVNEPPVAPAPPQTTRYRLTLYTLQHLQGHKAPPPDAWEFEARFTGFRLAADGVTALLFPADPNQPADPPSLLHLPTGERTTLPVPAKDWYCCGGWLSDGRLYLIGGGKLYLGQGADLKPLADVDLVWNAAPAPDGKTLALWKPGADGTVTLIDTATGGRRTLTAAFRRCAEDGLSALAWSPDGKLLAGTDCKEHQPPIHIVDPALDRLVTEIDGWSLQTWLATGELLAISPAQGEGAVTQRMDTAGKAIGYPRLMGAPSPDGKYLFTNAYKRQYVLIEYATEQTWALDLAPYLTGWTPDNRVYVITQP